MRLMFVFCLLWPPLSWSQSNFTDDVESRFYVELAAKLTEVSSDPKQPFSKFLPEVWDEFIRSNFFQNNQFNVAMEVRLFGLPTTDYKELLFSDSRFLSAVRHLKTDVILQAQLVNTQTGFKKDVDIKISPDSSDLFRSAKHLETKALEFFREQKASTPDAIIKVEISLPLDKYDVSEISPFLFAIESRMKKAVSNFVINHSGESYLLNSLKNISYSDLPLQRSYFGPFPSQSLDKFSEALSVLSYEQEHIIDWGKGIKVKARNIAGFESNISIFGAQIRWDLNNLPHTIREEFNENKGYHIDKIISVELPFSSQIYSNLYSRILRNPGYTSYFVDIVKTRPVILYTKMQDIFQQFERVPSFDFDISKAASSNIKINFYDNDPNVGRRYTEAGKNDIIKAIHNFSVAPPVDNISQRNCRALFR